MNATRTEPLDDGSGSVSPFSLTTTLQFINDEMLPKPVLLALPNGAVGTAVFLGQNWIASNRRHSLENTLMYRFLYIALAAAFTITFGLIVAPPQLASGDIIGAYTAGFVKPYSSDNALDAILCGCALAVWVVQETRDHRIRHGWGAELLGAAAAATSFAAYLPIRKPPMSSTPRPGGRA